MTRSSHLQKYVRECLERDSFLDPGPVIWRGIESALIAEESLEGPVLDAGCGSGHFTTTLYRFLGPTSARPIFGIDLDPILCNMAVRTGGDLSPTYRGVCVGNLREIPLREASCGAVISNSVLEHIPNVAEIFGEVARVLRPGGRLLFTVPTDRFSSSLFIAQTLDRLQLFQIAENYRMYLNRSLLHVNIRPASWWLDQVQHAGLRVVKTVPYLSTRSLWVFEFLWLALNNRVSKAFRLQVALRLALALDHLGILWHRRAFALLFAALVARLARREDRVAAPGLFCVAEKPREAA